LLWATEGGEEAREAWSRIPEDAPESSRARLYEGLEALFRIAPVEEVAPALRRAAADPGTPGTLARGALKELGQDWAGARQDLHGISGWEGALLRAYVEGSDPAGDRDAAVREYGRALEDGIPFSWAWNNRGAARQDQGDIAGAVKDYAKALEINPTRAAYWYNRGFARAAQGDMAGAIEDLGHALEINPADAEAWNNRGNARRAHGDLAGAIEDYGRAVGINPGHAGAWYNRSLAREAQGDIAGAIEDDAKALEVAPPGWPHRPTVEEHLARARAELGAGRK
ncbi:MAG: tetratricopeptide repeat protein, partial [Planctomycetales bacterium]|nr:tetratricopeptide repeat protein [Planctomycetales bacterium]